MFFLTVADIFKQLTVPKEYAPIDFRFFDEMCVFFFFKMVLNLLHDHFCCSELFVVRG